MKVRALAVTLTLLLAGPLSASPAEAQQQRQTRPAVWMVGDSVTVFSDAALRSRLAESVDGRVEIDAEIGRQVNVLDDMVRDELARARRPRTMVLALGANPVDGWSRRDFRLVVDSIPKSVAVVLVTVWRNDEPASSSVRHELAHYSRWMRSIAAKRENVCIAPWRGAVTGHATEYLLDGAHPNQRGAEVLADLVADAVVRCTGA